MGFSRRQHWWWELGLVWVCLAFALACSQDPGTASGTRAGSTEADAVAPRFVIQRGHGSGVSQVVISGDSRWLATSDDQGAKLWRADTGRELRSFDSASDQVALAPDGRYLLTGGSFPRVWDSATGEVLLQLEHDGFVEAVAVFPDGARLLTAGGAAIAVWDAEEGALLRVLELDDPEEVIATVAVSPDGELVAAGTTSGFIDVWDMAAGSHLGEIESDGQVFRVGFSPGGELVHAIVLAGDPLEFTTRVWRLEDGVQIGRFDEGSRAAEVMPDGSRLVTAGYDKVLRVWEIRSGALLRELEGHTHEVFDLALFPDGRRVASASYDASVRVWDLDEGVEMQRLTGVGSEIYDAGFSPDGSAVVTTGRDGTPRSWDLATGAVTTEYRGLERFAESLSFSADARWLLTGGGSETAATLWHRATGESLRRFESTHESVSDARLSSSGDRAFVTDWSTVLVFDARTGERLSIIGAAQAEADAAVAGVEQTVETIRDVRPFSNGRRLVTSQHGYAEDGSGVSRVRVWEAASGELLREYLVPSSWSAVLAMSPDGRNLAVGASTGALLLFATASESSAPEHELMGHPAAIGAVAFSSDGRRLASGADDKAARIWDAETGELLLTLQGHDEQVSAVSFSPDGRFLLTASTDTSAVLWEVETGRLLARLISFRDDTWVVVDEVGRFDTNNLDDIDGLYWISPEDPFRPLPLEIYLRDYYEPRLLPRILGGEVFPDRPMISQLNRLQPQVAAPVVEATDDPTRVRVTVEVAATVEGGATSGVHDVHLFRDGQLVGLAPDGGGALEVTGDSAVRLVFDDVRLPLDGRDEVEFSAYAFNDDRVKSLDGRMRHPLPAGLPRRRGRAYVVSLGVNDYDHARWDLSFAVNDARALQSVLGDRLGSLGDYEEVVTVPLLSDGTSRDATSAAFEAALRLLSGSEVTAEQRALVPGAERLAEVRPEDLVLLTFSGHGHAADDGQFYFLLSDIGDNSEVNDDLLERAVSSDELTDWLRPVDAGAMAMVIDACHSASSVEGAGFKPGPMGSRGLGQLSYDKGMMILAASQADDVALELSQIAHGLLSFSLAQEGLGAGRADHEPANGRIELAEWLGYGVERVPTLFADVRAGRIDDLAVSTRGSTAIGQRRQATVAQQPSLFNFRRRAPAVVLWQGDPP